MSLTPAIHESLPYIDNEPTLQQRAAAQSLIDQELSQESGTRPESHPRLLNLHSCNLSPAMLSEMARIETKQPLSSIDTKRYEALDSSDPTEMQDSSSVQSLRDKLQQAYTSASYLTQRQTNLALLDKYGKNGWLVGNSQLEDLLRGLEKDLAREKGAIDSIVVERTTSQKNIEGELDSLDRTWKQSIGRILETEAAAEAIR